MSNPAVFEQVTRFGVIPVIAIESIDHALPLADALIEGGLPVIEITFRTEAAAEVIDTLNRERPELLIGAGTLLRPENVDAAKAAGARFGVAPGLNPEIVSCAREVGLPFTPGVATPSDIEQALNLGCSYLKYFPAEALGGVNLLKALQGPYAHTGVRFIPTGGISENNLESYLALQTVCAVGGTWIAKPDDLKVGRWEAIQSRCRVAVETVARLRPHGQ
jgi:2-dehydro-3-deoxyphosphogluconate aldolase/(4S)-4-hydroxy-2-oxoglutarate aldolase